MLAVSSGWSLLIGFMSGLIGLTMIVAGVKKRAGLPVIFGFLIMVVPWLLMRIEWLAGLSLVVLVVAYIVIWKRTA